MIKTFRLYIYNNYNCITDWLCRCNLFAIRRTFLVVKCCNNLFCLFDWSIDKPANLLTDPVVKLCTLLFCLFDWSIGHCKLCIIWNNWLIDCGAGVTWPPSCWRTWWWTVLTWTVTVWTGACTCRSCFTSSSWAWVSTFNFRFNLSPALRNRSRPFFGVELVRKKGFARPQQEIWGAGDEASIIDSESILHKAGLHKYWNCRHRKRVL